MAVERRFLARVTQIDMPASYKKVPADLKDKSSCIAIVKDISPMGVRLIVPQFLALGEKLIVTLNLSKHRTFDVMMTPVHVAKMASGEKYEIGGQFLGISEDTKIAIREFCSARGPHPKKVR
jgi:hypothetical protein